MKPILDNDIVISGISGRYPKSASLQEFWDNLVNGNEMYTEESKRWTSIAQRLPKTAGFLSFHDQFDNELFGYTEGLANFMDPQQRLLHETTYEALYDAGLDPFNVGGKRAGCFVGSCYNDTNYARVGEQAPKNEKFYGRNAQFVCDSFNLKGVSLTVDTACAASFSALHQAIQAFKAGEIDFAVIGALSVQLRPQVTIGFTNLRMLSPEGKSKALDAGVDGYCRSEAVVSIVLQRRAEAKRIYANIYHSDTNCDGYKSEGITFPSMEAQYVLMKKVYADSGLDPERNITYVEGHMTGTPVGDPVETYAIMKALRPNKSRPLLMGCLKSNMGHSEGASALCGMSKVALIFQKGIIPPNINYSTPNPNIEALKEGLVIPILENTPFDEEFIGLNAFGFGGVNVHAILKANEKNASPKDYEIFKSKYKLPENWWSSRHLHALSEFDRFTQKNKGNDMIRLVNMSNRTIEGCNHAIDFIQGQRPQINIDFLQLIEDTSCIDPKTRLNHHAFMTWAPDGSILTKKVTKIDRKRPLYVIFSGLGCQWVQMATDLLQIELFARKIVELNSFTSSKFGFSLIDFVTQEMHEDVMNNELTKSLLAISSIQMALVDLIRFLDVDVTAFIGHSVGEYAAAYADGHATSEQILELIYTLSNICKKELATGTMASIGLAWKDAEARLPKDLYICCDNSSENVTIGGPSESIDNFLKELEKEEIFTRKVESCGQVFHAKSTGKIYDQVLEVFHKLIGNNKMTRSPKWISTSIGKDAEPEDLATYLADNVVKPVLFTEAIRNLPNDICCLELGPHAQLLPLIKQEKGRYATCVGSMKRGDLGKNLNNFFVAMGELYNSGIPIRVSKLFAPVQYPVSRQTLSISHLLKLDHSQPKFVYRYPEYYNTASMSRTFEVGFENPKYKSWYGHVIDGRILLPATGYLFLAWDALYQKMTFLNASDLQTPVEFYNISLRRAIVLSKGSTTEVKIKIIENTGEFSIIESEQVCCTGFVKLIEDCEKKIDHTIFKPNEEERREIIKKEDVYKEFRVRGYDYQGDFQGIVEVNASGREGRVKYQSSWVAFADALLQVSILGEKSRTLFVPTFIEYLRCEVTTLANFTQSCLKNNEDPILDVYYDPAVGIGATVGMFVKGMKVTETPRRTEKQKAFLQEYAFVPYENKLKLEKDTASKLEKYEDVVAKLAKAYAKKVEKLEEVELSMKELKDKYTEKELHSIANLLLDVIKSNYLVEEVEEKKPEAKAEGEAAAAEGEQSAVDENNNAPAEKVDENNNKTEKKEVKLDENNNEIVEEEVKEEKKLELNETIKERQEELNQDLLFAHVYRQLLTNHIAIIMENLSIKQVRILEINYTASLFMDYLTFLVSAGSQARTEYNLLHPMPALKAISSKYGINKVLELKPDNSISGEISASNIVVYKHWSTGFVNNLESLDLNYYKPKEEQEKELLKNAYAHMNDSGFLIFCYRTKLTFAEEQLMELGEQDTKVEMPNKETLLGWIKEAGFEYIGEEESESETGASSFLARKICKDLVKVKKDEEAAKETKNTEEGAEGAADEAPKANEDENKDEMENPLEPIPIEAKLFDYRWVVKVKKQLKIKSQKRIWLIAKDSSINGVVGMLKCLKKEPEGERIRCLFNVDACEDNEFVEDKIKNGLLDPSLIDEEENAPVDDKKEQAAADGKPEEKKEEIQEETDEHGAINLMAEKKVEKTKEELEEEAMDMNDENAEELKKLITQDLVDKDLTMNIVLGGKLGSYRQKKFEGELAEETEYAVLDIMTKGDLSSFKWLKSNMKESFDYPALLYPLQAKYVKEERFKPFMMDIYYSALNFKDVMVASGRVPRSAYPATNTGATNLIGMEFSGKRESDGKRVMGLLPGSGISTKFLCIDESNVFEVPDDMTLAEAATLPVVYMTAYYSLFVRGNLLPGEKVLIHAGSGGVGFAAISICLKHGCEVFTTVSTKEKREFLQKHFPQLQDRNFANSRNLSFEEHILKETNGYGVDIVLNSLAEEKLRASVRCLAPYGRFLEIGKYDIISNNPIDTTALSENRTLHCICLAHLLAETVEDPNGPGLVRWNRTCDMLKQGIKKGEVKPLNYSLFTKDECEQAFRFMANGKHMGKVLIEIRKEDDTEIQKNLVKVIPKTQLLPQKSYIVTGGLGGFGIELALWMIQIGCRQMILTSRSGIKNSYQEMQVRRMREDGCNVVISNEACDTLESTQRLLAQANEMGPLGGIFHLAMVLHDGIFTNQTKSLYRKVGKPKIDATFYLDYLTRDLNKFSQLDYFICFSSVASAIGNPGQCNYAFANSAMERIVEKRAKDLGEEARCKNIAIQWGAIGDVGAFAEKFGNDVNIAGMVPQRIISCMKTMDEVMQFNTPVLSSVVLQDDSKIHALGGDRGSLIKTIMHVLGVNDPSSLDPNVTLTELGMDSLMAVEIKQGLEREYDIVMTTQEIRGLTYKRLQEMSAELEEREKNKDKGESEVEKDNLARLEEIFNSKDELFVELHHTQATASSKPIFFIPPIEGDFVTLRKTVKYITRPVVGISWINEFDDKMSIKEVCAIIVKRLIQKYGICEFDLVGYSFGAVIALEVGVQLQINTSATVRKLILLDGSPEFTKAKCHEIANMLEFNDVNEDKIMTTMLVKFAEHVTKMDNPEEIEERLSKLPDLNARVQSIVQLVEGKFNFKIDPEKMQRQVKRLYNKCKMVFVCEISGKLNGDIYLIRATETKSAFIASSVSESYGIEKVCTGKTEFVKFMGDHKTFILNNAKEVGHAIDSQTIYLSI